MPIQTRWQSAARSERFWRSLAISGRSRTSPRRPPSRIRDPRYRARDANVTDYQDRCDHRAGIPRLATVSSTPPSRAAWTGKLFAQDVELLAQLHKRGVTFFTGIEFVVPGHSVHRELELYVEAGFTPMEAIRAATIVPARFMHRDRELGTVEPGKRADLVIVRGDPLSEISAIRKTSLVVARGRVYDSPSLWKLVGFRPAP
jgi:hypothetical protein